MSDKNLNKISTDQLIDQMAGDIQPVKPAKLRTTATLLWVLSILVLTCALVLMTGHLRTDVLLGTMPVRLIFGVMGALLVLAAAGSGFVRLLVPGRTVPLVTWLILGVGFLQMVWSVAASGWTSSGWNIHNFAGLDISGMSCAVTQSIYAAVLSLPLIFGAKRYAPTNLAFISLFIGFMAVAAGFGGLLVHCASDDVIHLALYHLLPAAILSLGSCGLVVSLLRW